MVDVQARNQTFARGGSSGGADGEGSGEGYPLPYPLPSRLGGLGERRKLPQRGLGRSPAASESYTFCQSFDGLWRR